MATVRALAGYAAAVAAAAACTLAGFAMQPRFDVVNIAMVYLLAVVLVALRYSRGPAIAAALLSVVAFDVLFVPPFGTVKVDDLQYLLTFAIMVAVAVVISRLVERIRREAADKAALAIEAETERVRSTLLASISHDLRTPLAVMAGASSSLAESGERLAPDERRALAASVFRQSRDMADYVAKILQMTRLDAGAIVPDRDWNALAEIAGAALDRLGDRLARHRVLVEMPGDLPLVRVDAALVEQAIGNLVENAAKHTPPDTVIRVRAERRGDEVVVTVEDYGDGLSDRDAARVFDKFTRGAAATAGGPGLGLAICRAIVRLHGGRAWADRPAAGGAAFHFALPLEAPPTVPAEAADA
jgi:two-component system sensor histidine kinase KdpD